MPKSAPKKDRIAIYPGTFDPVTYGHIDLIERGLKIFDKIIVAVALSETKNPLFTIHERISMIQRVLGHRKHVSVEPFKGLVVDYALKRNISVLLRGIRMLSDFENEFQMALTNRKLNNKVETLFLMPNESYAYLTSRLIKEIVLHGGDVRAYVPTHVYQCLKSKFGHSRKKKLRLSS